jgi:small-conductance mechanosensitive channel
MMARFAIRGLLPVRALPLLIAGVSFVTAAVAAQDSTRAVAAAPAWPESATTAAPQRPAPLLLAPAAGLLDQMLPGGGGAPAPAQDEGALTIANRPIITFRAAIMGYSPRLRAEVAESQIQGVLARGVFDPVTTRPTPEGIMIEIGGTPVFRILPSDADATVGETLPGLRDVTVARLEVALAEVREARNLPHLLRAAGRAALATILFAVLAFLVRRPFIWAGRRLETSARAHVQRAEVRGLSVFGLDQLTTLVRWLVLLLKWGGLLILLYAWLTFVLSQFPYTRLWGEVLGAQLAALLGRIVRAVVAALPGLFIVAVIFFATRWVQGVLSNFFDAVARGTAHFAGLHPDTVPATRRIAAVLLWLFALALAYPYLPGSSSAAFQGVTVIAGLMLSLGSSTLVGQLLSGFMIIYSRSVRAGDYVRSGEVEGVVLSIGLFATKIRTNRREEVAIPNSVLLGRETKNYSLSAGEGGVITGTSVTIGYGTPWRQVHAMLLQAAARTPGLKAAPAPFVLQTALTDFYVEYTVNGFLEQPETRIRTLAALHANIQDAFNEHGVQILSPHYESDPPAPVFVPKDRWYEAPARSEEAGERPER